MELKQFIDEVISYYGDWERVAVGVDVRRYVERIEESELCGLLQTIKANRPFRYGPPDLETVISYGRDLRKKAHTSKCPCCDERVDDVDSVCVRCGLERKHFESIPEIQKHLAQFVTEEDREAARVALRRLAEKFKERTMSKIKEETNR